LSVLNALSSSETSSSTATADKREQYASRVKQFRSETQRLRKKVQWMRIVGVASGLACAAAILAGLRFGVNANLCWLAGTATFLGAIISSLAAVKRQEEIESVERLADVNLRAVARIDRDWRRLPLPTFVLPDELLESAQDLDLFGHASLFHLICRARTPWGIEELGRWIASPPDPDTIRRRQRAIEELIPNLDFRQRLEATASFIESLEDRCERFASWLADPRDERWLRPATWIARVLTAVSVGSLAWLILSETDRTVPGFVFTGAVGANLLFSIGLLGRVHTLFGVVSEGANDATRYRKLIDAGADLSPSTAGLAELHATIARAQQGIRLLDWLALLGSLQSLRFVILLSSMPLLFLVYILLQFVLLWDFHVASALSWWRRRYGSAIEEALRATGQLEAVSSLASLADEHPDWTFAQIRTDGVRILEAKGLGHPLIPPERCVRNDVSCGPPGSLLVVTGSNMSGKSTLLRAIGTNVVLAQAGAPVCARALLMPAVRIATVMRVTDSLEAGISLFMAELLRIRRVVDAADRLDSDPENVLLFLLDEILQGTNSAERQIAAVGILGYLVTKNAIGAVSTHDLDLVAHPSIAAACRTVHFRESFTGDGVDAKMVFDYIMRSGVAPTTNVPFLLKTVGLPYGPKTP